MAQKLYRTKGVAEILKISEDEVRRRLNSGELLGRKSKRRHRWLIYPDQEAFANNCIQNISLFEDENENIEPVYRLIKDVEHEEFFAEYIDSVEDSLYIATANFKNIRIRGERIVDKLNDMYTDGIDVKVICARWQTDDNADFDCIVCPRNHMKMFIFDKKAMYIGSANLTPAALEDRTTKSRRTNNHEAGIFTTDEELIREALEHFEEASNSNDCSTCSIQDCPVRN